MNKANRIAIEKARLTKLGILPLDGVTLNIDEEDEEFWFVCHKDNSHLVYHQLKADGWDACHALWQNTDYFTKSMHQ